MKIEFSDSEVLVVRRLLKMPADGPFTGTAIEMALRGLTASVSASHVPATAGNSNPLVADAERRRVAAGM